MGRTSWYNVRDAEQVMCGCRRIAREISELVYSWGTKGKGKMEEVGIGDKKE